MVVCALSTVNLQAAHFWATGKIKTTLTDSVAYAGCMVYLDTAVGNGCSTWVSLDCTGTFYSERSGEQKYAAALMAFAANKTVKIYIDDSKTVNGSYCVAQRIDVVQ